MQLLGKRKDWPAWNAQGALPCKVTLLARSAITLTARQSYPVPDTKTNRSKDHEGGLGENSEMTLVEKITEALGTTRLTKQQESNLEQLLTQTLMRTPSEDITVIQMQGIILVMALQKGLIRAWEDERGVRFTVESSGRYSATAA